MVTRVLAALAVVFVAVAVLLLGPIHATGVRGTALHPRYVPYYVGFFSYSPAGPANAKAALAQAGITAPDVAVHRRIEAAVASAGVAALIGGVLLVRSRRAAELGVPAAAREDQERR
ncbi:MAG TPA: hypothetical protein VGD55_04815 [Acidothermaceae bacterium]